MIYTCCRNAMKCFRTQPGGQMRWKGKCLVQFCSTLNEIRHSLIRLALPLRYNFELEWHSTPHICVKMSPSWTNCESRICVWETQESFNANPHFWQNYTTFKFLLHNSITFLPPPTPTWATHVPHQHSDNHRPHQTLHRHTPPVDLALPRQSTPDPPRHHTPCLDSAMPHLHTRP